MSSSARQRQWAEHQIEKLTARIQELRAFVATLDEYEAGTSRNGHRPPFTRTHSRRPRAHGTSLPDQLAEILARAGANGLTTREVWTQTDQSKPVVSIAAELFRQAKHGRRGIVKVGRGRYAVRGGSS